MGLGVTQCKKFVLENVKLCFGLLLKTTNVPCEGCETLTDMATKSATNATHIHH